MEPRRARADGLDQVVHLKHDETGVSRFPAAASTEQLRPVDRHRIEGAHLIAESLPHNAWLHPEGRPATTDLTLDAM